MAITRIPVQGDFIIGDAGRAGKLIGSVILGNDSLWWEITTFKTRRNPISVDYVGYGKPVSEKTAKARLAAMRAKSALYSAQQKRYNAAICGREDETREADAQIATLTAEIAKLGKQAEKITDGLVAYTPDQHAQMRNTGR